MGMICGAFTSSLSDRSAGRDMPNGSAAFACYSEDDGGDLLWR